MKKAVNNLTITKKEFENNGEMNVDSNIQSYKMRYLSDCVY
jgi:hypothetical protein